MHEVLNYVTKNTTMRVWGVYKIVVEIPKELGGGLFKWSKNRNSGQEAGRGLVKFPLWWEYGYFLELHIRL